MRYSLSRVEKNVLYLKHRKEGLDIEESIIKVNNTKNHLKNLKVLNKENKKSKKFVNELNRWFKEEFKKLR